MIRSFVFHSIIVATHFVHLFVILFIFYPRVLLLGKRKPDNFCLIAVRQEIPVEHK